MDFLRCHPHTVGAPSAFCWAGTTEARCANASIPIQLPPASSGKAGNSRGCWSPLEFEQSWDNQEAPRRLSDLAGGPFRR